MILVLGPVGAGKTLLLKRLEEHGKHLPGKLRKKKKADANISASSIDELDIEREKVPRTVPTIGTNIRNVSFAKCKDVVLKEVGGSMAPLWKSSYQEAEKIIYVMDLSNPFQVSCASVLLSDMLSSDHLKHTPVLLILNKIDNFSTVSHTEMKYLLRLDSIIANSTQQVSTIEASAKYSSGIKDIVEWISQGT